MDHVRPVAAGGTNDESNLVSACQECNISKSAKTLLEWIPERVLHGVANSEKVYREVVRLHSGRKVEEDIPSDSGIRWVTLPEAVKNSPGLALSVRELRSAATQKGFPKPVGNRGPARLYRLDEIHRWHDKHRRKDAELLAALKRPTSVAELAEPEPVKIPPVTLVDAVRLGLVDCTLAAARQARARDGAFPNAAEKVGREYVYNPYDLAGWSRNRRTNDGVNVS